MIEKIKSHNNVMINFLENILIAATIVSSIYVFPVELKVLCYDLNETPNYMYLGKLNYVLA